MSVESSIEGQNASIQEAVESDAEITPTGPLTTEIATLIDRTSSLHQHDYVVGKVTDYGTDPNDNVHFKLVHRKKERENKKDDRFHCIIYENRRQNITAAIRDGQRVAGAGDLSFYTPRAAAHRSAAG